MIDDYKSSNYKSASFHYVGLEFVLDKRSLHWIIHQMQIHPKRQSNIGSVHELMEYPLVN